MPQNRWSAERERQYQHVKEGVFKRGESEDTAEEIAARMAGATLSQEDGKKKGRLRALLKQAVAA